MKQVIALSAGLLLSMSASAASFLNGGFENGNLGSWENGGGSRLSDLNPTLSAARFLPGGNLNSAAFAGQVSVVGPGNDPNVGALLRTVNTGNFSARIGDTTDGGYAGAIAQTVVNYTAATINFSWAAVLEPAHTATDSPLFNVRVLDITNGGAVIYNTNFAAFTGSPTQNLFLTSGSFVYAPWQNVAVNTTIGNTYRIELLAADCQPSAHLGYAYLDGFGSVAGGPGDNGNTGGTVPVPGTVALLALGLIGAVLRRKQG